MKTVNVRVVGKGPDNTVQIEVPDDMPGGSNPFAMVRAEEDLGGSIGMLKSNLNGIPVYFANRADMDSADRYIRELMGEGGEMMLGGMRRRRGMGGMMGGSTASNFLETGGDAALSLNAYLQGQQLRRLRADLLDSVDASNQARDGLNKLSTNSKYSELIPVLMAYLDADRQKTDVAVSILDTEVTAVDIQLGGNVARLIGDLWGGASSSWSNGGSAPLIAGAVGIGLGAFLSTNRTGRGR